MADPFMAELRIFSFDFPPQGWAYCNGQLLPINQNQALFSLLGVAFGGNGQTNFALPDLRGRIPIHMGQGYTLGQRAGEQAHTLTASEMPAHLHFANASNLTGNASNPNFSGTGYILAQEPGNIYGPVQDLTTLNPASVTAVGGSQPHENMQPYLVLNFCIALQGIFPSHN